MLIQHGADSNFTLGDALTPLSYTMSASFHKFYNKLMNKNKNIEKSQVFDIRDRNNILVKCNTNNIQK